MFIIDTFTQNIIKAVSNSPTHTISVQECLGIMLKGKVPTVKALDEFEAFLITSEIITIAGKGSITSSIHIPRTNMLDAHTSPVEATLNTSKLKYDNRKNIPLEALNLLNAIEFDGIGFSEWQVDTRNRMYDRVFTNLHFQGDKLERTGYMLANKKLLDNHGMYAVRVALADELRLNYLSRDDRSLSVGLMCELFDSIDEIVASGDVALTDYISNLYHCITHPNEPTGILVSSDATSSGIQIMSAMTPDRESLINCNLISIDDTPRVPYSHIASKIGSDKPYKEVKRALMTLMYNSVKQPETILGTDGYAKAIEAMIDLFPGAVSTLDDINSAWVASNRYEYSTPDGHEVLLIRKTSYVVEVTLFSDTTPLTFNYGYKVEEVDGSYKHLAPNIVQSIDGYLAARVVITADAPVIPVHDAFYSHPNDSHKVQKAMRIAMSNLVREDHLSDILKQINPHFTSENTVSQEVRNELANEVLKSNYILN